MIDFTPTAEQQEIVKKVRSFVDEELIPLEQAVLERGFEPQGKAMFGILTDAERTKLEERADALGLMDSGIGGFSIAGQDGIPAVTQALVSEEMGRTPIMFSFSRRPIAPAFLFAGSEVLREKYMEPVMNGEKFFAFCLTEPTGGSDARNIQTRAVRDGDEWVINGEKKWMAAGDMIDFVAVVCRTTDDEGNEGISMFLVDREMGWTCKQVPMMNGMTLGHYVFKDVRVPADHMVGDTNTGFMHAIGAISTSRGFWIPPGYVGASRRLVEMAIEFAKNRVTFGEPLADRENIQWMIAESDVEIRCARALYLQAASMADQGLDNRYESAAAKLYSTQAACRIVDRVMQIHGALGFSKETIIEYWYRSLRAGRFLEGTDEIQLRTIARGLIKRGAPVGGVA